ncbi:hypothetical protein NDU88_006039 [Pleurodeles waltl]|uniref:Uncharacterized protein n=1 Tax=Pleurodeles waltl TaxID=8319 RepID=A0AAV7TXA7_PLEWA|nr:hypothetical protein NDU88_006039 [Pleurodeles waltl]
MSRPSDPKASWYYTEEHGAAKYAKIYSVILLDPFQMLETLDMAQKTGAVWLASQRVAARLAGTAKWPLRGQKTVDAILAFPLGRRATAKRAPSGKGPATRKPAPNGAGGVAGVRRVQLHPSRFSLSAKQTVKIFMGPVRGPLHCPCLWHGQCRGPQGPHDSRSRHPVSGGENRQKQAGGKGVGIPKAALQAVPPWRIPLAGEKPAEKRRTRLGDRGFTAAVGIQNEAPPACWRCFSQPPPWRS